MSAQTIQLEHKSHIELSSGVSRCWMKSNDLGSKEVVPGRDAGRDGEALKTLCVIQSGDAPVRPIEPIFPDFEPAQTSD